MTRFSGGDENSTSTSYLVAFVEPAPAPQDPLDRLEERLAFTAIVDSEGNLDVNRNRG